jgi:hypothetical protein
MQLSFFILHYTRNYYIKVLYFLKIENDTSLCGPTACGASVDTPHKFVRPSCYYQLQEIEKCNFMVASSGITSTPNFIQIHPAILKLNHADRHDQPYTCFHFMHIMQRMHKNGIMVDKRLRTTDLVLLKLNT